MARLDLAPGSVLQRAMAVVAVALVLVVLARSGPAEPAPIDVVRARRFELIDETGRVRAALTLKGGPRLMLYDAQGRHRIALALHGEEAPGLELFTADGTHALQVRHVNGDPVVSLHDPGGHPRLQLGVSGAEPRPSLTTFGAAGDAESTWPPRASSPPK